MLTRRGFAARLTLGAAAIRMSSEMAYAQRAAAHSGRSHVQGHGLAQFQRKSGRAARRVARCHARSPARLGPLPLQRIPPDLQGHRGKRGTHAGPDRHRRGLERSPAHRGRCLHLRHAPADLRHSGLRRAHRTGARARPSRGAHQTARGLHRRREAVGRSRPQGARRADLPLQSEQPHVRRRQKQRRRLAGRQPARQHDAPGGRGLHPFRGIARRQERAALRAPGQGRDRRPHLLQDLRHGRPARRIRRRQARHHPEAARLCG